MRFCPACNAAMSGLRPYCPTIKPKTAPTAAIAIHFHQLPLPFAIAAFPRLVCVIFCQCADESHCRRRKDVLPIGGLQCHGGRADCARESRFPVLKHAMLLSLRLSRLLHYEHIFCWRGWDWRTSAELVCAGVPCAA